MRCEADWLGPVQNFADNVGRKECQFEQLLKTSRCDFSALAKQQNLAPLLGGVLRQAVTPDGHFIDDINLACRNGR
jgi:hypothetical protein